ncbi:MAG: 1-acyl-sn-glycerol-3-phosphate acyltransferase [Oscillospiraceae bacterium]|jgi:1-acyl-sn-glycerol-3-phosphate acyltransferase|nr:1-acyl-sn-glycerol-3-phosphate acyltransferase [Oscillospiraceae bacterium]
MQQSQGAQRRQAFFWRLFRPAVRAIAAYLGHACAKPIRLSRPTLILSNHNTDLDPAFLLVAFKSPLHFVASEHVFRWGIVSKLITFFFQPIARQKGGSDARAAMDIARTLRRGEHVCLFAEGNRSVDGITAPIAPATGMLVKASGADLITYRLIGGYFTQPRWSATFRRGRMRGEVVGHYSAEALHAMSKEEINEIIRRDLHEDAYARQRQNPIAYRGKRLAEHLETALYRCPACGQIGRMHSEGDQLLCECGLAVTYTEQGMLTGAPFDTVSQWYAWQLSQAGDLLAGEGIADADQRLYRIAPLEGAELLAEGLLRMTRDMLTVGECRFALIDIAGMAILGQRTLTFTHVDGTHYEVRSERPRSAYCYLNAFENRATKEE